MENYKIIYGDKEIIHIEEISEKKSKFIAHIKKVETEQEAVDFINQIKKKHFNANHNCSAFVIGSKKELVRSSDDGEPQGTAGKPMLDVLMGSDIVNIVAVVTRYFGGTLLGKGGLMRAYSGSLIECVAKLPIATMNKGNKIKITTDYNIIGNILHKLSQDNIEILESEYTDIITLDVIIKIDEVDDFIKSITEISAGKSKIEKLCEIYFEIKI